jgi:cobalamin synthase
LGTFGVSALVLFWLFRYGSVDHGRLMIGGAAIACLFSRAISLGLGLYFFPRLKSASTARSSHVMQAVSLRHASFCLGLAVFLGTLLLSAAFVWNSSAFFVGLSDRDRGECVLKLLVGILFSALASAFVLKKLICRTEALNGDLLGATVCFSEILITTCYLIIF